MVLAFSPRKGVFMSKTLKIKPRDSHVEGITEEMAEPATADLLPIQEFVHKLGGLDRARLAIDTLEELREVA
jgi:hypothetical protein